jgi:hypothetical protein
MDSDNKHHHNSYKIIFPVTVLGLGLALGLILAVIGFEFNSKKAGGGIAVLLLFAVVAGILADMKNHKNHRDN